MKNWTINVRYGNEMDQSGFGYSEVISYAPHETDVLLRIARAEKRKGLALSLIHI